MFSQPEHLIISELGLHPHPRILESRRRSPSRHRFPPSLTGQSHWSWSLSHREGWSTAGSQAENKESNSVSVLVCLCLFIWACVFFPRRFISVALTVRCQTKCETKSPGFIIQELKGGEFYSSSKSLHQFYWEGKSLTFILCGWSTLNSHNITRTG